VLLGTDAAGDARCREGRTIATNSHCLVNWGNWLVPASIRITRLTRGANDPLPIPVLPTTLSPLHYGSWRCDRLPALTACQPGTVPGSGLRRKGVPRPACRRVLTPSLLPGQRHRGARGRRLSSLPGTSAGGGQRSPLARARRRADSPRRRARPVPAQAQSRLCAGSERPQCVRSGGVLPGPVPAAAGGWLWAAGSGHPGSMDHAGTWVRVPRGPMGS